MVLYRYWIVSVVGSALFFGAVTPSRADEKDPNSTNNPQPRATSKPEHQVAFMGLMIEELPPALTSHVPGIGHSGQGLIVVSVGADSPAEKAGVKVHDILMTYDDQKLFVPEQLLKLIANDTPGRDVKLGLIRGGKQETSSVHLGERTIRSIEPWMHDGPHPRRWANMGLPRAFWRGQPQQHSSDGANHHWTQFDSMTLKKIDKDRFHANISFTDKDGKTKRHEYEGTREEIRQKIEGDSDLQPTERLHLLRSLDIQRPMEPDFDF